MRCPECGAENPEGSQYCSLCYTRFSAGERMETPREPLRAKYPDSLIRCPNCGETSPVDAQFCLKCAFSFEEERERYIISREESVRLEKQKKESLERESEKVYSKPVIVDARADGARIMRAVQDILDNGYKALIHAGGRDGVTRAVKLLALLGEEYHGTGQELLFGVTVRNEGSVVHLDDLEVEITVLLSRGGKH